MPRLKKLLRYSACPPRELMMRTAITLAADPGLADDPGRMGGNGGDHRLAEADHILNGHGRHGGVEDIYLRVVVRDRADWNLASAPKAAVSTASSTSSPAVDSAGGGGIADPAVLNNAQGDAGALVGLELLEAVGLETHLGLLGGDLERPRRFRGAAFLRLGPGYLFHTIYLRPGSAGCGYAGCRWKRAGAIWPPLPQPPPWFISRSLPMASIFFRVVKTLPVSTTAAAPRRSCRCVSCRPRRRRR